MSDARVIIQRHARRYLEKLPLTDKQRILENGDFVSIDVKRLKGRSGWRYELEITGFCF